MQHYTTQAIIVKRINYGEADRIFTFLTASGTVSAIAKGVRRPKSKLAGGLELFSNIEIAYVSGRGQLFTITSARITDHYANIVKDAEAIDSAYNLLSLSARLAEHSDETIYFNTLLSALDAMNSGMDWQSVYVWAVARLQTASGLGINLEKPLDDIKFIEVGRYGFSFDDMAFFIDEKGQFMPSHIKYLRLMKRCSDVNAIKSIARYQEISEPLAKIMKQIVDYNQP